MEIVSVVFQYFPLMRKKEKNLDYVFEYLEDYLIPINDKKHVIVLPELAFTGYNLTKEEFMAVADRKDSSFLEKVNNYLDNLKKGKNVDILLVFGHPIRRGEKLYNSAVITDGDNFFEIYDKLHLFYEEKDKFEKGKKIGFYEWNGIKFGVIVCFDWIFPELSRLIALKGASVIFHPSNLVLPYAQKAMWTRSVENRIFTVLANRIGEERGLKYTGKSQIVSPTGGILASIDEQEGLIMANLDLSLAENKDITEKNNLFIDRRVDLYQLKER